MMQNIKEEKRKMKILLRDEMRILAEDFSKNKDDVLTASIRTSQIVTTNLRYSEADTILIFMSLPNEIQTGMIIEQALKDGKQVAIPKVLNKKEIDFYYLKPELPLFDQVQKGLFSISEPLADAVKFVPEYDKQILILVPGLAFATTGERLGQGMGYYDRFLNKLHSIYESKAPEKMPFIAGICYDFQIYPFIPMEPTDVPVDCVFTDKSVLSA